MGLSLPIVTRPLGDVFYLLLLAAPIGAGALAACWLTPPRTWGDGAQAGTIAGLISGIASTSAAAIDFVFFENLTQIMSELLWDNPTLSQFGSVIAAVGISIGCVSGLVFNAVLGGFSGMIVAMIMAAAKSDQDSQLTPAA